jgi:hypothetical protein
MASARRRRGMLGPMTWIKTAPPTPDSPAVQEAMREGLANYPGEYAPARRGERQLPALVLDDSIILAHSLIPAAMKHIFAAYGALLDPALPLTRRQHEMIAATVSSLNQCFY